MDYHSKKEKDFEDILSARVKPDKSVILGSEIIIYGAGSTGKRVLILLKKYGVKINCFLDKNGGDGVFIDDIPVLKPDDITVDRKVRIIVALFNHTVDTGEIIIYLKRIGFKDVIAYSEFFIDFSDELPVHYWLGPNSIYEDNIKDIKKALNLFHDEESRNLFNSFLKFRITGVSSYMPRPDIENIYFPSDIIGVRKPSKFVDCGAFDGDTLLNVRGKFGVLESIRAFEPNLKNFCKLVAIQTDGKLLSGDTILIPCGVWSSTIQRKFISDDSAASSVSEIGDSIIQCVALDECLNGYDPTLIKMDIEGGEIEALKGCQKIITSVKPDLAISVYHTPEHLWKIPLFIKKLNPDYRCYLRSHGYNGYDTVFYAYK